MPDPFRRLPAPILLDTMKLVPSLPSLYQLTRASGATADMFGECPAEIVGAVIGPLPEELRRIIRAVAMTLLEQCADQESGSETSALNIESVLEGLSSGATMRNPIPLDLPLSSTKILVGCACHIYQLTAGFLECHIKRLNAIQPQHLFDPRHGFRASVHANDIFENYPKGRAYTPPITGTPSWVEEYRVVRALWLLQLYRVLETKHDPLKRKSSPIGAEDYGFSEAWGPRLKDWELDNMECVQDWLNEMHVSLYPVTETGHPSSLQVSLEEAERRSILEQAPTDKLSHAWQQDFDASQHFSMSFRFFHTYGKKALSSVLKNSQWKTFRRLGFGIWDLKRMAVMELLAVPKEVPEPDGTVYRTGFGVPLAIGDVCFTWKSIEDQRIV